MTDAALKNALVRLMALEERRSAIHAQIDSLRTELDAVSAEHTSISKWVVLWHEMAGVPQHKTEETGVEPVSPLTPRTRNPPRSEVVAAAKRIIARSGRPMTRRRLLEALSEEEGLEISGKNPEMVLGTMLWREPHEIVRLPNFGYWIATQEYQPARYHPLLS